MNVLVLNVLVKFFNNNKIYYFNLLIKFKKLIYNFNISDLKCDTYNSEGDECLTCIGGV